jgi:hypothetical protein
MQPVTARHWTLHDTRSQADTFSCMYLRSILVTSSKLCLGLPSVLISWSFFTGDLYSSICSLIFSSSLSLTSLPYMTRRQNCEVLHCAVLSCLLLKSKYFSWHPVPHCKCRLNFVNLLTWVNVGTTRIIRYIMSRDSSVSIATGCGFGGRVSVLRRVRDFAILHSVHVGSVAYPDSYPMDIGSTSSGEKSARAWNLSITFYPMDSGSTSPGGKAAGPCSLSLISIYCLS